MQNRHFIGQRWEGLQVLSLPVYSFSSRSRRTEICALLLQKSPSIDVNTKDEMGYDVYYVINLTKYAQLDTADERGEFWRQTRCCVDFEEHRCRQQRITIESRQCRLDSFALSVGSLVVDRRVENEQKSTALHYAASKGCWKLSVY
jgi:hypothetical protein